MHLVSHESTKLKVVTVLRSSITDETYAWLSAYGFLWWMCFLRSNNFDSSTRAQWSPEGLNTAKANANRFLYCSTSCKVEKGNFLRVIMVTVKAFLPFIYLMLSAKWMQTECLRIAAWQSKSNKCVRYKRHCACSRWMSFSRRQSSRLSSMHLIAVS